MHICYYNKMRNENETGELNMLKMLNVEEVSEYVLNSEVFEVSGVYKVMLNDDCEVVSSEIVEESENFKEWYFKAKNHYNELTDLNLFEYQDYVFNTYDYENEESMLDLVED